MKTKRIELSRHYLASLRKHLDPGPQAGVRPALGLGSKALANGLDALDVAQIHEKSFNALASSNGSSASEIRMIKRAGGFLTDAITPIEDNHRAAVETIKRVKCLEEEAIAQNERLAKLQLELKREVERRKAVEQEIEHCKAEHTEMSERSRLQQEQVRYLAHQLLMSQEAERKEISRELHDQIAQTLTGINIHLVALKAADASNAKVLAKKIASMKRLVERSVNIVHRFARELRPTVLDDLGLIPAIHSYLKDFTKRTHLPVRFTAFAGVEQLSADRKTVLYRVIQAALTNVIQHAKASGVTVRIRKMQTDICMEINDNGKSFNVESVLFAKRHKRLGVLGMRERVEMVGGTFTIKSAPDEGTTIWAQLPFLDGRKVRHPRK